MSNSYAHQTLHDYALDHICAVAESMGYQIKEVNFARDHRKGPDVYIINPANRKGVVVESELGHNITSSAYEKWEKRGTDYILQARAPDNRKYKVSFLISAFSVSGSLG